MDWNSIISVLATLAAFIAAAAAWRAANATKKAASATYDTAEAGLVKSFLDEYNDYSMAHALRKLKDWKKNHGVDFDIIYLERLHRGDSEIKKVEKARRKVKGYFEKAVSLYDVGLIREKSFNKIAYVPGLNVFYDVVDVLMKKINPEPSPALNVLKKELGRHKESEHVDDIFPLDKSFV